MIKKGWRDGMVCPDCKNNTPNECIVCPYCGKFLSAPIVKQKKKIIKEEKMKMNYIFVVLSFLLSSGIYYTYSDIYPAVSYLFSFMIIFTIITGIFLIMRKRVGYILLNIKNAVFIIEGLFIGIVGIMMYIDRGWIDFFNKVNVGRGGWNSIVFASIIIIYGIIEIKYYKKRKRNFKTKKSHS